MDYSESSGAELQVMPNKKEFLIMSYYWKSQDGFFFLVDTDLG